ncbi:MAG: HAMP domain-containing protein [Candidatus Abyssobacteria bacterium SURF_5]|uniref:histidine kinase n=1 Tax=Abyssobacteria bacterium (strain SURF_5) TaxID=2093360 RepID=A0A3A4N9R5_ABYX5|nr:MAG: HAMP domain-containing protein [Candidatus Abyssubacteria bacterium SURF_5]
MKDDSIDRAINEIAENVLLTAQRKLLKPRIQNKLIFAFVSTAVVSIALSTYFAVWITSLLTEREIEKKIREANAVALSIIEEYEGQALQSLTTLLEKPGFIETLRKEKVSYVFTPPIMSGSEIPIGLWVPSGQPLPATGPPTPITQLPSTVTKTVMTAEVGGIQTLLAGAVVPVIEGDRSYGTIAIGYALGKSFAQDIEIITGVDIRIFHEKIPAGPSSIYFEGSSAGLPADAHEEIEQIAKIMLNKRELMLVVEGHTDSIGAERDNYRLGRRRAEAVKDALVEAGIEEFRIQTISFGESRASAPETSEEGLALNRRVELEFKTHEDPLVGAIKDLPMTSAIKQSISVHKQSYYDQGAFLKGEPYRAIYQPLVGYGGKVLGLIFAGIPRKYTFAATVTTWYFFPLILLAGFALASAIGYTISRGISQPIRILYRKVLAVAYGDLDQHFDARTKDEIGDLGRAFNIMTMKLHQLRELEHEMQRRNRLAALGELSAGVAHEIRNPLGIIKNSAEMLRDRIQDDAKRRELTDFIVEEVARLNKVVTDFLLFARPLEPDLEPVDINTVLEHTLAFLKSDSRPDQVRIERKLAEGLPKVLADPEQCRQVFLNLFMNAFQAMNGKGTISVETRPSPQPPLFPERTPESNDYSPAFPSSSVQEPKKMVDVVISDTGTGIQTELLPRIFDPFFSTKDEGAGLGLSLVHKIIENHNGRIKVTSKPGAGTTFIISLPVASNEERG